MAKLGIGAKHDAGKLRWDLLPLELIEGIVETLTLGADEYGEKSWQTVPDAKDRYYAALMRHLREYQSGNKIDKKSGLSHIKHVMANAMFLYYFEKNFVDCSKKK